MNSTIRIQKRALASAVAMAVGASSVPQTSIADITLTFQNNTTPSSAPLPYDGFSAGVVFPAGTEFRVMTPYGTSPNDGFKDAMFGGENWTFDNSGELIGTGNVANAGNPGTCQTTPLNLCTATITSGVAGFPICATPSNPNCPVLEQGADFLGAGDFNFLAPVKGSIPGDTYGVATVDVDLGNNSLSTLFPVTHAQWADGSYIIGADDPANTTHGDKFVKGAGPGVAIEDLAVTVTSAPGAADITLDFVLHGESRMTKDEVTVGGFNKQIVQWELPGSATINNQNPVANNDGGVTPLPAVSGAPTTINVLANDTDPDWLLLKSQAFDNLEVATAGPCTNGGTLTDNNTNAVYQSAPAYTGSDSCSYTITDGRTGASNTGTVFLNVVLAGGNPPTAFDDGPGNTPGGPYTTNQGVAGSFDVLANDNEIDGDAMTVTRVDAASTNGGTVTIINAGAEGGDNVMYVPASGFNGVDTFTYDVSDVDGTDTATVTVQVVAFAESSAGTVTVSNIVSAASIPVTDPETTSSCVGGCFETEVTGVPAGGQVEILARKRSTGYQTGSVFRQFVDSTQTWKDYEAPDSVQTAPQDSVTGLCPGIASSLWRAPTAGDTCTKYTLTDNGPNDENPVLGEIRDPVGFGQTIVEQPDQQGLGKSGCTLDKQSNMTWRNAGHWMLIGAFVAFVRLFRKKSGSGSNCL